MSDSDDDVPLAVPGGPAASTSQIDQEDSENCIKILLATDNHIGYNERDPIRGQDSVNTFKEILELAVDHDVDMLLLAGDLFHENKPSRSSLYQVISLLREYTLGSRPIALQLISDAGFGLGNQFTYPQVNYEDANLNIGLPVFSIHGNHDDPQGAGPEGALCALDILSACGLVNYFGRQDLPGGASTEEEMLEQGLHIKPVLLQKGDTKLAMYGIGAIRDERFNAEMRKNRITLFQPSEGPEEWFNLMLIHQNRANRGVKNTVPESGFGDDIDLVIWGHEHDCRITPEPVAGRKYHISQPGSSVATSLAAGEAIPKHVALLKIQGKDYQMEPIQLKTVRPFVYGDIILEEAREAGAKLDSKVAVNKFLKAKVEELIRQANDQWDQAEGRKEDDPRMLPLIRLRVDYSHDPDSAPFEVGNPQRFGQDFTGRVANPRDIVQFSRKKAAARKAKVTIDKPNATRVEQDEDDELSERMQKIKVESLVHEYLGAQKLQVIAENGMTLAVDAFVDKEEKDAIKQFIRDEISNVKTDVRDKENTENRDSESDIEHQITDVKELAVGRWDHEGEYNVNKKSATFQSKGKGRAASEDDSDFGEMSGSDAGVPVQKKTATQKKKAPAASSRRAAASSKGKKPLFNESEDEEEGEEEPSESEIDEARPKSKRAPAKSTQTKAPATKTTRGRKTQQQSQLDFAPSRSTIARATPSATARAKSRPIEIDDSSEEQEEQPTTRGTKRRR